jgi:hypothetical protein
LEKQSRPVRKPSAAQSPTIIMACFQRHSMAKVNTERRDIVFQLSALQRGCHNKQNPIRGVRCIQCREQVRKHTANTVEIPPPC